MSHQKKASVVNVKTPVVNVETEVHPHHDEAPLSHEMAAHALNFEPAIDLIKEFEGYVPHSYRDGGGVWTIGFGTAYFPDGRKVGKGLTCTQKQAHDWLLADMTKVRAPMIVKECHRALSQNELCALISLAYNIGNGGFRSSRVLRLLNSGAPKLQVANAFLAWVKDDGRVVPGLVRRRKAERTLFLSGGVTA